MYKRLFTDNTAKNGLLFMNITKLRKYVPFLFVATVIVVVGMEYLLHDIFRWELWSKHDAYKDIVLVCLTSVLNFIVVVKIISKPLTSAARNEDSLLDTFVNGIEDDIVVKGKLNKYFDDQKKLNELTSAHLNSIVTETDSAAQTIINQSQQIDQAMTVLHDTITTFQKESEEMAEVSQTTISNNKENIDSLSQYVEKRVHDLADDQERANVLMNSASTMIELIDLISDIADRTNLLALNASIEAARAGEQGRSFAVVAGEVRNLSTQTEEAATQIGSAVKGMIKQVETQFADKLTNSSIEREKDLLANLEQQLTNLGLSYEQLDTFKQQILTQVDSISNEVAQQVMELLANIQFQDITRQQIEQVVGYLSDLDRYIDYIRDISQDKNSDIEENTFSIDHLLNSYVMEKQRLIHKEVHSGEYEPDDLAVTMNENETNEAGEEEITFF